MSPAEYSRLHSIESEQSVLGALLIDPNAFDRIDFLDHSDFYREDHRIIYRHIVLMLAERKPVDVITVAESLQSSGVPNEQIGLSYLGELQANTPSAANIVRYAEVVRAKRSLRDLLEASARIADLAQADSTMPVDERIDEAQAIIFALAESRQAAGRDEDDDIGAILSGVVEDIQARFDRGGQITGTPTGFADLDEKTCGLHGGDLIIVAGRPSMGKTAFALNVAEHVAANEGKPVLVFSMEMSKKQLVERSIASLSGVPTRSLRTGQGIDFDAMTTAVGKLFQSKLRIIESPALTVQQMRSRARRMARKNGLSLIVVDYIQLASGGAATKNGNREQEVSSVSRGLKALAKEFNCPVIALSQLSRKVEDRADKRPMLSDLRESGAIEQDADIILMMYRDEYYNKQSLEKGVAEIIIGKQRMGETGVVRVLFQGEFSRFRSLTEEAKRDLADAVMRAREQQMAARPVRGTRGFNG